MEITIANKVYDVQVALTEQEKQIGLSNITSLPENEGMLFDYSSTPQQSLVFTMKNTAVDLDIVFINTDLEVIAVESCKAFDPYDIECVTDEGEFIAYVLEVAIGSGITTGDELDINDVDDAEIDAMYVLDSSGKPQMKIIGGERICSRLHTKKLISLAKKANKNKKESDYKKLGEYMFKILNIQNTQEAEYVQLPD